MAERRSGAAAFRSSVRTYLDGLTKNVQLIQKSPATLSGRSATIPVTVQNNLVQGVKGLTLELTSSQPNRLDTGEPQEITVDGGHSQSFKFDTTANANGPVQVTAQLYTSDGKPYGRPMTFQVNVTEITSTIMLVIAGGVLLLVLAGVRIYLQRKRAAWGATATGPTVTAGPGTATETAVRTVTSRSSRVTASRTPVRKARTGPAQVRKWTVDRWRGRMAGDG